MPLQKIYCFNQSCLDFRNYYSPRDPPPQSVDRKILSQVQTPQSSKALDSHVKSLTNKENESNASPITTMLRHGSKRKKNCTALSSVKRLKENHEEAGNVISEQIPRKKLLFPNKLNLLLEELPVARTPEEINKKMHDNHPCFSQIPSNSAPSNRTVEPDLRRNSMADFQCQNFDKFRKDAKIAKSETKKLQPASLVCTSLHSKYLYYRYIFIYW